MIGSRRFTFSMVVALQIGAACHPGTGSAAQPRASVGIKSGLVKLSDLFSGLEKGQDCDIGPAPAPGKRVIIGQPQLAAIAEQFGVEWQPGMMTAQVVLEREARMIGREELLPLLRSALVAGGAPASSDISLAAFSRLLIPAEITNQPEVESLDYDHASGRFVAGLVFESPGVDAMRLRVTGMAQEMIEVPVLVHTMNAGSLIAPEDLEVRRLRKNLVGEQTLTTVQDAAGLALRHRMMAGIPIALNELSHPLLVTRGMPVLLRLQNTGLLLTAKGEAIEGGALDELIHVLNPDSRAVLIARVTGPGLVQVDPESAPVLLSPQQSGLPTPSTLAATTRSLNEQGLLR